MDSLSWYRSVFFTLSNLSKQSVINSYSIILIQFCFCKREGCCVDAILQSIPFEVKGSNSVGSAFTLRCMVICWTEQKRNRNKQLKEKETQRKNRGQVYSSPSVCLLTETNKSDGKAFSKQQISTAINQSRGFHDLKNFWLDFSARNFAMPMLSQIF